MNIESKQKLINRLKNRLDNTTKKFNVHLYKDKYSKENEALLLLSDFLKKAIEGIEYIKKYAFDDTNNYKTESEVMSIVHHIYNSSLLYYLKMFRGGEGVKRENLILKEKKLFDSEGNEKKKNGQLRQPSLNRFYIEEFFTHDSNEFRIHHKILHQVNKLIVHIDETDLARGHTLLLFDKAETSKYLGIDNHFEYLQSASYSELVKFQNMFKNIRKQVDEKIYICAKTIHEILLSKTDYELYYDDLIINENEV